MKSMPGMVGGFGKIKDKFKLYFNIQIQKYTESNINSETNPISYLTDKEFMLRLNLGAYLAGLIEADGSFAIHDIKSKANRYLPKIIIVFNLNDELLAEKLILITEVGKLYTRLNQGCVL